MPCIHIIISECVWRRTVCESAFGAHYTRAVKSPLWSSSSKYEPPSQMINHAYTCMWYVICGRSTSLHTFLLPVYKYFDENFAILRHISDSSIFTGYFINKTFALSKLSQANILSVPCLVKSLKFAGISTFVWRLHNFLFSKWHIYVIMLGDRLLVFEDHVNAHMVYIMKNGPK